LREQKLTVKVPYRLTANVVLVSLAFTKLTMPSYIPVERLQDPTEENVRDLASKECGTHPFV